MGRRLFQDRAEPDGAPGRRFLVARLAAVDGVEIHPWTFEHLLAQLHLLPPRRAAKPRAAALHLPPLGRSGVAPLSAGLLGRHLRQVGDAGLPALLHVHLVQCQLRLLGPRHRGPHVQEGDPRDRPRALHPLAAIRRLHPDLQDPLDQGPAHRALPLVLPRPPVRHARRHPPALHARTLYLCRGPRELRHGRRHVPPDVLRPSRAGRGLQRPRAVHVRRRHPRHGRRGAGRQRHGARRTPHLVPRGAVVRLRHGSDVRGRPHRRTALHPLGKPLVRPGRSHPSDEPADGEKPPAAVRHAGADLHPRGRRRTCPLRGRRRQPAVRHGLRHHEGHQDAGGQHPARRHRAPRRLLRGRSRQPQL